MAAIENFKTGFTEITQATRLYLKPKAKVFQKLLKATFLEWPPIDIKLPEGNIDLKVAHVVRESFKVLAKLCVIGAGVFTLTLALPLSAITLVGVVASTYFYILATDKAHIDGLVAKLKSFWISTR